MIRAGGDMRSEADLGIAVRVSPLYVDSGHRIRIIRAPDLRKIREDPQIEAIAPGGAALKENFREALCQLLHHAIETENIAVACLLLPREGQGRRIDI